MDAVRTIMLDDAHEGPHSGIPVAGGMRAGISLAAAGDMALSRERTLPCRARYLEGRGIPREKVYALRQVHSRCVHVIEGQTTDLVAGLEGDGLVTNLADAVLSITVADCLPIFLADARTGTNARGKKMMA